MNRTNAYVRRTALIDTATGEVLEETVSRTARPDLRRTIARHGRHTRPRLFVTREANELLIAGLLVMLLGVVLWILAGVQP